MIGTTTPLKDALDLLEALTRAVPRSGPDPDDYDFDTDALLEVVRDAELLLLWQGRLLP